MRESLLISITKCKIFIKEKQMKNVLMIAPSINSGGIATVIRNLCISFSTDYNIDIVTMEKPSDFVESEYCRLRVNLIVVERINKSGIVKYKKNLFKILTNKKYDVIHIHNDWLAWISAKVAKKVGVHVRIGHAHGQCFGNGKNRIVNFFGKLFQKLNRKYCTDYIGCSEPSIKHMFGCNGVLIPNYIPFSQLIYLDEDNKKSFKQEMNIPLTKKIIGYAGSLGGIKNTDFIYKIAKEMQDEFYFVLAGGASDIENKKKWLVEENINNVRLLGYRNDVSKLYNIFDMYICTSISEGMSLSLIQAQMMCLPTVVSNGVPNINDLKVGLFYKNKTYDVNEWIANIKAIDINKDIDRQKVINQIQNSNIGENSIVKKLKSIYES